MTDTFDILIVGAGPSGCASALGLNNSGLRIALVDKAEFPRKKACGDSIPAPAFTAISSLNPQWGHELSHFTKGEKINKTTVYGINGQKITKKWKLHSYNCKRYDFDNFLLNLVRKQSKVSIFENTRLTKIVRNDNQFQCVTEDGKTIKSALIIGCDGANSIVKRSLIPESKNKDSNRKAFAVTSYFEGVSGLVTDQNEMFNLKKYPNGYFWIFPVGKNRANVGFGLLNSQKKQKKINISEAFQDLLENDPYISPRFKSSKMLDKIKGAYLPFGGAKDKISGNRFMLCGDAASLINPLGGAGIDNAIRSGIYAADQAMKCFDASKFSSKFMIKYEHVVDRNIRNKLNHNYKIMKLAMRWPWLINIYLNVFKQSKD